MLNSVFLNTKGKIGRLESGLCLCVSGGGQRGDGWQEQEITAVPKVTWHQAHIKHLIFVLGLQMLTLPLFHRQEDYSLKMLSYLQTHRITNTWLRI